MTYIPSSKNRRPKKCRVCRKKKTAASFYTKARFDPHDIPPGNWKIEFDGTLDTCIICYRRIMISVYPGTFDPIKAKPDRRIKKCTICGKTRSISQFYLNGNSKDGLNSYCKECHRLYNGSRSIYNDVQAGIMLPIRTHVKRTNPEQ